MIKILAVILAGVLLFTAAESDAGPQIAWSINPTNIAPSYNFINYIQVDTNGFIYLAGATQGTGSIDCLTAKMTSSGSVVWVRSFDGPLHTTDTVNAMAVSQDGSVCVLASTPWTSMNDAFLTIKYDSSGAVQWTNLWGGSGIDYSVHRHDTPIAIACDKSNNIYLCGTRVNAAYNYDQVALKYDANGSNLWVWSYNNLGCSGIVVDQHGNAYVNGSVLAKLSPDGAEIWRTNGVAGIELDASDIPYAFDQYGGFSRLDPLTGITTYSTGATFNVNRAYTPKIQHLDKDTNFYTAGYVENSKEYLAAAKLSANGVQKWAFVRDYGNIHVGSTFPTDMAVDTESNLWLLTSSGIFRYSPSGLESFVGKLYGYVATASDGSRYIAGSYLLKFSPSPINDLNDDEMPDAWELQYFGDIWTPHHPQDDPDSDGFPNLLEYAAGSSPTNSASLPAMNGDTSTGLFALRFNRNTNASDITLIAEGSDGATNNATWKGIATNILGSWGGATNVIESGTGTPVSVSVQDTTTPPSGAATNRFLRLRVTRP
jgi:hypothetical protein